MVSVATGLTSSPALLYGVVAPLVLIQLMALLYIPSLLAAPAKARAVGEAIHCYCIQTFGVMLMTIGSLPTVYSVLAGISYTGGTYFGLLLIFATGGGLFLWQDQRASALDPAARAVPASIFLITFRMLGQITLVLALLSFLLSITMGSTDLTNWWIMPVLMACYGGLISWCTHGPISWVSHTQSVGSLLTPVSSRPAKAQTPSRGAKKRR
jgi:hypothetical protein